MVLTAWGDRYLAHAAGPPTVFRHRDAEHVARPTVVCGECGEPLTIASTYMVHGPGALPDARPYLDPACTVSAHRHPGDPA